MTWFDIVKSSELKEFEILAEKYAETTDMVHLDYLKKKHGKKSNEFYMALNKQVYDYLRNQEDWSSLQDIVKGVKAMNPKLSGNEANFESFLRRRIEKLDVLTKQEKSVGRTGKKTFYKV